MKENPQFQRTDKAIKQALISLLRTTPFEKITVQNILDETPVTRSTFYKHYHDKYEIAERMQDDYFALQADLSVAARKSPYLFSSSVINQIKHNRELLEALLQIHTEKVDIRQALANQSKEHYLSTTNGANAFVEAEIYSQTVTAFQLAYCENENSSFSNMYEIYISVFLKLLGLADDKELRQLLSQKILQSLSQMSEQ